MKRASLYLASVFFVAFSTQGALAACYEDQLVPETISCGKTADDGFADFQGKGCQIVPAHMEPVEISCDVVIDIRSSRSGFTIKSLFDSQHPGEWSNTETNKILNIHPNVIVGSTSGDTVSVGGSWKGTLTLNVMGEIQGGGGAANGGAGGDALNANSTGAGGAKMKVNVASTGALRGGGGGGGKGGAGGKGGGGVNEGFTAVSDTMYQPWFGKGKGNVYHWSENRKSGHTIVMWNRSTAAFPYTYYAPTTASDVVLADDGYAYKRGAYRENGNSINRYDVTRGKMGTGNTDGGKAGAGGNGGTGQGYNAAKSNGIAGAAGEDGGASAGKGGAGGKGGNGGTWGADGGDGSTGSNGVSGNRTTGDKGVSGSSGGAAGRAIVNSGNIS